MFPKMLCLCGIFCFYHFCQFYVMLVTVTALQQQVVSAMRAGVNPVGTPSNETSLWDLGSSFFFAGTVITTIGKSPLPKPLSAHRSLSACRCWDCRSLRPLANL